MPAFHCIDLAEVMSANPANFTKGADREKWFANAETADAKGFPEGRLRRLRPVSFLLHLRLWWQFTAWVILNVLPLLVLVLTFIFGPSFLMYSFVVLSPLAVYMNIRHKSFRDANGRMKNDVMFERQFSHWERDHNVFFDRKYVLPDSLRERKTDQRRIMCYVPHGIFAVGAGYPGSTIVFAAKGKLARMLAAPVIFRIPIIRLLVESMGGVPAKKKDICEMLDQGHTVQVVLDGVAGIYQGNTPTTEPAYLLQRKQICAIAKSSNAEIVPAFVFGGSEIHTPLLDPFGIISEISIRMNVSFVAYLGSGNIPFGPPRRVPLTVCYGDPIPAKTDETVEAYHQRVLDGFSTVFDTHKHSYGWGHKKLVFV